MKIREKVKYLLMVAILFAVGGALILPKEAMAVYDEKDLSKLTYADCYEEVGGKPKLRDAVKGWTQKAKVACGTLINEKDAEHTSFPEIVQNIINVILYIVGILAVVMIIFGGIQYTTSAGDTSKVTKAKNTILYGIVGLVISILAYAIVNFVISKV